MAGSFLAEAARRREAGLGRPAACWATHGNGADFAFGKEDFMDEFNKDKAEISTAAVDVTSIVRQAIEEFAHRDQAKTSLPIRRNCRKSGGGENNSNDA